MGRVCMLGLDGLSPQLLFVDYWPDLPNFQRLRAQGGAAVLHSCEPPITVPAWACMMTGRDPGALGCYGFHDRQDFSYAARRLASSLSYLAPPLWTQFSEAGVRCRILGVPQTYPAKPVLGALVTGALTPAHPEPYASYPTDLWEKMARQTPPYKPDIDNFRALGPEALVQSAHALTAGTFAVVHDWLHEGDWDFLCAVDMGADRLQHGLWAACRPEHPDYVPGHPQSLALRDYYRALDGHVGQVMDSLRPDDVLMVVSDHGAQAMHGGFALNDWLVAEGYLVLRDTQAAGGGCDTKPNVACAPKALAASAVDWSKTQAWADGGYVGRIYLNVQGREPQGIVAPSAVAGLVDALTAALVALPEHGLGSHAVHKPQDLYAKTTGVAPDLFVYMAELRLRVLGTLGHATLWPKANDRGFDAANHAHAGVYLAGTCTGPASGRKAAQSLGLAPQGAMPLALAELRQASLYDIAPTLLRHFGLCVPGDLRGQNLWPAGRPH